MKRKKIYSSEIFVEGLTAPLVVAGAALPVAYQTMSLIGPAGFNIIPTIKSAYSKFKYSGEKCISYDDSDDRRDCFIVNLEKGISKLENKIAKCKENNNEICVQNYTIQLNDLQNKLQKLQQESMMNRQVKS